LGAGLAPAFGVGECVPGLEPAARPEELALPLDDPLAVPPEAVPPEAVPPEAVPPEAVPPEAVPPAPPLDVLVDVGGVWVAGGVDEDEEGEQPAKAAEARMAKTPRRMAVSFALSTEPAITRTVM
jgi:hypothetical protein